MDMNHALKMIKEDMGSDAVIISSRPVTQGGGRFGLFSRKVLEVTAAPANHFPKKPPALNLGGLVTSQREAERSRAYQEAERTVVAMEPVIDEISEMKHTLDEMIHSRDRPDKSADRIAEDVREMKSMMSYLLDQSGVEKKEGLPRQFIALARILEERGVAPKYVETLIDELRDGVEGHAVPDTKTLVKLAAVRMRDTLTFGGAMEKPGRGDKKPRVIAIVGPTGVGKTTTVAKLAANLVTQGASVALATIDTYRIAAVEQLKIYAGLLNVPLEVIINPGDMAWALNLNRDKDVVFIDTAGRSQRDLSQIEDLRRFLGGSNDIEIQLALAAPSSERQQEEAIKNFSPLGFSSIIFTKLDEAATLGPVFNQNVRTGTPISYFTVGQSVPEDIEEATAKRLLNGIFRADTA